MLESMCQLNGFHYITEFLIILIISQESIEQVSFLFELWSYLILKKC